MLLYQGKDSVEPNEEVHYCEMHYCEVALTRYCCEVIEIWDMCCCLLPYILVASCNSNKSVAPCMFKAAYYAVIKLEYDPNCDAGYYYAAP